MRTKIKLIFPYSTSKNYSKAVKSASLFEHFRPARSPDDQNVLRVDGVEFGARFRQFENLYEVVSHWTGTEITLNDAPIDINDWHRITVILQCTEERDHSVVPEQHCEHQTEQDWGCKHLATVSHRLPETRYRLDRHYAYWFQFGRFGEGNKNWILDKGKLLDALMREVKLKKIDLCPVFSEKALHQRVTKLPDSLDLSEASFWTIRYTDKYDRDTVQKVPTGIMPKSLAETESRGHLGLSVSIEADKDASQQKASRFVPQIAFADVGGVDEIVGLVREVIELPLKQPNLMKHLGISRHKGILLYGPPGCGKTRIAQAIANEIQAHFISIRGPELFSKWFGESEENLRTIFEEARQLAPSIIFFDEIDSIGQKRSGEDSVRHESIFVNQLLTLMDGMETYENVCVIASTNRPELLDDALVRPGRFDYTLEVKTPTKAGCLTILQIHTRNMPLSQDVDLQAIATELFGYTGADIAFVAHEGAYNCLRRNASASDLIKEAESDLDLGRFKIGQRDFLKALETLKIRSMNGK